MFGERLRLARKKAGYSLRGLSRAIDGKVSAQAIGKYERGEMMPSSGVLMHLAKELDVSVEYLLSERVAEIVAVEFRKLSRTRVRERAQVKAEVIDRLQRYIAVEEILDVDGRTLQLTQRFAGRVEDGEVLAQELRDEWKLGIDPILNMTAVLEDRGIRVLVIALPDQVSGLTCLVQGERHKSKMPVIVVNRNHTLERRRLTLAHELAHRVIDDVSTADPEETANVFAGAFLVPRGHLIREIGTHRRALGYRELIELKHMYRVSAVALLVRLKQLGVIDQSTLAYAFQTFARGWRNEEPEPLEGPDEKGEHELPRRFERLCYRALAEKLITPGKAAELLEQPLAEIETGLKGPAKGNADRR